jgi:hypothetical protein
MRARPRRNKGNDVNVSRTDLPYKISKRLDAHRHLDRRIAGYTSEWQPDHG